jgi:transposase-like protein
MKNTAVKLPRAILLAILRPVWKCKACRYQLSVTAGTIFADRKRPIRDYLIFANGAKGHSALQLSRDLGCQYKTAFVLAHKLREAIEAEQQRAKFPTRQ